MPVKRCILEGRAIGSLDDLYDELGRRLSLPEYFGRNLDALWDFLATDVEGPLEIVWRDVRLSQKAMGADFDRITSLLRDLEKERDNITVKYEQ